MVKQWKTACPLNCYDVCGLIVTAEGNKIIKIEGDKDHPITKGKICGKGKLIKDRMYHKDRLLYPQKKVNGQFERISWDQALDEIGSKIKNVLEAHGPLSIMHSYDYSSGGLTKELDKRFFNSLGGFTDVTGSLCWGAGKEAQLLDMGNALSHDLKDIYNAKTLVVWGRNITTTNMHLLDYLIEAKDRGAKLIVIDPMKNGIAKLADLHIAIRPGMDGLLAIAMIKIIVDNGWQDKEFIQEYSIGFERLLEELDSIDINDISKEISVNEVTIFELAKIFSKQKPVMSFLGLGMQRYGNGGNTVRAIDALAAACGNIGIPGGGVNYANLAVGKSFDFTDLLNEEIRREYRTFKRPSQAREILEELGNPIKLMFISKTNLVTQLPNTKETIEAIRGVETKVVLDMFMTDTAQLADYLLPISSVFEEEDIYYGSMLHGVIRYGPQVVEPPKEVWSDLKFWSELSKRLGIQEFEIDINEIFDRAIEPLNKHGITLDYLKEEGQAILPITEVPYRDKRFDTPSGKFEFYSEEALVKGLPPTAVKKYPNEVASQTYPYQLLSIHPNKSLHSQHFQINEAINPIILISEETAVRHDLKENQKVIVYNGQGRIEGFARIKEGNFKDAIIVEEGLGLLTNCSVNLLTPSGLADMGGGSTQYDCTVNIKKFEDTIIK